MRADRTPRPAAAHRFCCVIKDGAGFAPDPVYGLMRLTVRARISTGEESMELLPMQHDFWRLTRHKAGRCTAPLVATCAALAFAAGAAAQEDATQEAQQDDEQGESL